MFIDVVDVEGDSGLAEWLAVRNELEPDEPLLLQQLFARRAAEPDRHDFLAIASGGIVGVGSVGPKGSPADLAYGYLGVREGWKQRGVESALLVELRRMSRELGRSRLELWACEDDHSLVAFLVNQGFCEFMREGGLALDIANAQGLGEARLPEGVSVLSIGSRREFGDGAYELAALTWPDIPGETGIEDREPWLSLHVSGAPEGALVAVDEGKVVGFAGLHLLAEEGLYEHGLLAVHPDHRRRGIARAMKMAQLCWLNHIQARRVVTWNAETNDAARTLNLSLGYKRLASSIAYYGPA